MATENYTPLEIAKDTRDALRRVRMAATTDAISPEEMQQYSETALDLFAKALLELKKPNLLRNEDLTDPGTHIDALNNFTGNLLVGTQKLNLVGNPLDSGFVLALHTAFARDSFLKKFLFPERHLVALLSTGALALAVSSYLYNAPIYVAAVSEDRTRVVLPNIPEGPVTVVDDVVGRQANATADQLYNDGRDVETSDLM